jgi:beta-glucosidase
VGWRIDPDAFRNEVIATHRRYKLPIYITENGYGAHETLDEAGGVNDSGRIAYLAKYTKALEEAVASGADVRGYFLWSLLDNLEWGAGFASRFGIVYIDYATQKRVPKASFDWFAELIRAQQPRDHA